jgi:hypothetical protein
MEQIPMSKEGPGIGRDIRELSLADLADLFGGTEQEISAAGGDILSATKFQYYLPEGGELDSIYLDILHRLNRRDMPQAGEARLNDWEKGWAENLNDLLKSGFDITTLAPKYLRAGDPVRLRQQIAVPIAPHFVRDYTLLFRNWVFHRYLKDAKTVYEFGCGPGAHLAYLANSYPDKELVGLDWAEASAKILAALAGHYGWNLRGAHFDFFNPDRSMSLHPGAAVVTFGALEQTGPRHNIFLDWLLERKPALCLHVEPMNELYDPASLVDSLSLCFHKQKGYLDGFLETLRRLQDEKRIMIEKVHRHRFGTKFNETYSYVVWRPVK